MAFCDVFTDSSVAKILDHLARHEARDFSLTELARECGVSYRTIQRVFPILVQNELVTKTRQIGKATMYSLNLENTRMRELHHVLVRGEKAQPDKAHHVAYT